MSSNISVAITAETADLQAKLALAQSNLRAFSTETRSAADALRLAGAAANDDMKGGLDQAASSMARAKAEVTSLKTALGEAGGAQGFGGLRERIINANIAIRDSIGAFSELGAAIGAVFVGERIFGAVERTAELGASLLKLSKETGVAVETLSGWHYAADQMEVAGDALDTGLVRLGRNIEQALTQPTGEAARAFENAGISQDFLRKNSNDLQTVLLKLADSFQAHAAGGNADAEAMAIFGKAGAELLPFLQQGSAAIATLVAHQKELRDQMTTGMTEAMDAHRRAVKDLTAAWDGFAVKLTNSVAPALTLIAQDLTAALAGPSIAAQVKSAEADIADLTTRITYLKQEIAERPTYMSLLGAPGELEADEKRLTELQAKLAALRAPGGSGGAVQGGAGAGAGAAGAAGGKPAFGDLSQPVAELEKFRAKLDDVKLALQQQGASAQDVLLREAELWRQEASAAGLTAQEVLQARQQLDTTWSQLLKQKAAEAKAEADQETRAAKQAADEQTRDMTTNYRQQMELVKSDNDEALAAIKAAHSTSRADELQAEAAYWRQIIALTRAGTQQQIEAIKQLGTVTQQITTEQAAQWQQAERQLTESFTGPATRAFDTMVQNFISRTQPWEQTLAKAFEQMAESFIESVAKMIAQWLAFEALTAVGGGGVASALGMSGGPLAALFGAGGGAGLGALFGGGGAAGGAGAITDLAGLAMFDTGTMGVPQTMMAMVHQGEIIVPAGPSSLIRSGSATLGGPGAGGGMTLAPSFNLNLAALDARSVQQLFSNPTFTRMLTNLVNRGAMLNPSLS